MCKCVCLCEFLIEIFYTKKLYLLETFFRFENGLKNLFFFENVLWSKNFFSSHMFLVGTFLFQILFSWNFFSPNFASKISFLLKHIFWVKNDLILPMSVCKSVMCVSVYVLKYRISNDKQTKAHIHADTFTHKHNTH